MTWTQSSVALFAVGVALFLADSVPGYLHLNLSSALVMFAGVIASRVALAAEPPVTRDRRS